MKTRVASALLAIGLAVPGQASAAPVEWDARSVWSAKEEVFRSSAAVAFTQDAPPHPAFVRQNLIYGFDRANFSNWPTDMRLAQHGALAMMTDLMQRHGGQGWTIPAASTASLPSVAPRQVPLPAGMPMILAGMGILTVIRRLNRQA